MTETQCDGSSEVCETTQITEVICPATKEPSIRVFIMALMLLGFAIYCFIDQAKYPYPTEFALNNDTVGYVLNHWSPYVFIPTGVVLAGWGVVLLRRRVQAGEKGIGHIGGEMIPWHDVMSIDATRLKSKGLIHIDTIKGRRLTLDSWKIQDFRQLLEVIEKNVEPEQYILK